MLETVSVPEIPDGVLFEFADPEDLYEKVTKKGWYSKADAKFLFPTPRFVARSQQYDPSFPKRLFFQHPQSGYRTLDVPPEWKFEVKRLGEPTLDFRLSICLQKVSATGCDPEIFVVDGANHLIPAYRFLPSKREAKPHNVANTTTGYWPYPAQDAGSAYWDGFQAEFSTRAMHCHGYHFDMIRSGLHRVINAARAVSPNAKLTLKNTFRLTPNLLDSAEPEHVALGCEPSFNAYGTTSPVVDNPRELPYRFAGGHIHFSLTSGPNDEQLQKMVQGMDLLAALPAVGLFAEIDNPVRRAFYGKAGEYRRPKYGLEYRTLSNAWLGHPAIGHMMFDLVRKAHFCEQTGVPYEEFGTSPEQVQEIINNCDVDAARKLVESKREQWLMFLRLIPGWGQSDKHTNAFFKMVQEGVESMLPNYRNVEANWNLDQGGWIYHTNNSRHTFSFIFSKLK